MIVCAATAKQLQPQQNDFFVLEHEQVKIVGHGFCARNYFGHFGNLLYDMKLFFISQGHPPQIVGPINVSEMAKS